jgi:Leucine-rich repeat (LRR) protein
MLHALCCEAILQALESLSVADNHLQHLPASMAGLASLKQLWAYGNHLQSLPADILDLPAIRRELTALCPLKSCCPISFALCQLLLPFAV